MQKTLMISDTQIEILLEFYRNKINEIDAIITPYLNQKSEFESLILQLQGGVSNVSASESPTTLPVNGNLFGGDNSEYDTTWSVPRKALFVLAKEHRDLSTSSVFDKLLQYEPNLAEKRGLTMVLISSGFKDKTGKTIYRTGKKRGEYKYGLLEWKKPKAVVNDGL